MFGETDPIATRRLGELSEAQSLSEAALNAYGADRHELFDRDGGDGDGNSAVPESRPNTPNIPNTVRVAAPYKAARGFALETIGKIRGAGLKPVASTPRLVFTSKLLR